MLSQMRISMSREIPSMLIESARGRQHKVAIATQDRSISYQDIDRKSDRIRDALLTKGIRKRSVIAILIEDTVELVAAILGILKADCIFVPIDPRYPANRMQAMVRTADP